MFTTRDKLTLPKLEDFLIYKRGHGYYSANDSFLQLGLKHENYFDLDFTALNLCRFSAVGLFRYNAHAVIRYYKEAWGNKNCYEIVGDTSNGYPLNIPVIAWIDIDKYESL